VILESLGKAVGAEWRFDYDPEYVISESTEAFCGTFQAIICNSLDRHTQCHPCEQFILYWLVRSRAEVDGILLLMWDEKVMENLGV